MQLTLSLNTSCETITKKDNQEGLTILKLSSDSAKNYFLQSQNYCNFDLPKYFNFDDILSLVSAKLKNGQLESFCCQVPNTNKISYPGDIEDINHLILSNKDGDYSWRPFELIHPVLYVDLVNLITEENNWDLIKRKFNEFQSSAVKCESIPRVTTTKQTHRAEQVKWWWENIEQESVRLGLEFKYVFDADISNYYPSIYTHSIAWALHTKTTAREDKGKNKLLGSKIDKCIQKMRYRQTNGIPQGNTVSDLVAEMVLGYADLEFTTNLRKNNIKKKDFRIIRYRDDYKIFTNHLDTAKAILKILMETLSGLGLKLNTSKTKESYDPILASFKEDKIDELFLPGKKSNWNYAKWLLQIYATVSKHPNSGKAARQLCAYYDSILEHWLNKDKLLKSEDPEVLISMATNLAIKNPRYYNWSMAIISIVLNYCTKAQHKQFANKIVKKFATMPNTGMLDIWLQRITYKTNPKKEYPEPLTELVYSIPYRGNIIWNSHWLISTVKNIVHQTSIVDERELQEMKPYIDRNETSLFKRDHIS